MQSVTPHTIHKASPLPWLQSGPGEFVYATVVKRVHEKVHIYVAAAQYGGVIVHQATTQMCACCSSKIARESPLLLRSTCNVAAYPLLHVIQLKLKTVWTYNNTSSTAKIAVGASSESSNCLTPFWIRSLTIFQLPSYCFNCLPEEIPSLGSKIWIPDFPLRWHDAVLVNKLRQNGYWSI